MIGQSWGAMLALMHAITRPKGLVAIVSSDGLASMSQWVVEADRMRAELPEGQTFSTFLPFSLYYLLFLLFQPLPCLSASIYFPPPPPHLKSLFVIRHSFDACVRYHISSLMSIRAHSLVKKIRPYVLMSLSLLFLFICLPCATCTEEICSNVNRVKEENNKLQLSVSKQ